jgi:hypothetical protein
MYFDKPVLIGDSDAFTKINAYFETECQGFFFGSEKSKHFKEGFRDWFYECVYNTRERYGDDVLAKSPLYNKVDSEIVFQSPEILSIKLTQNWMAGGVHNVYYYGANFDLNTGELLYPNHFVHTNISTFNDQVISLLYNHLSVYGIQGFTIRTEIEEKHKNDQFDDYEFYYDGKDIYLISDYLRNDFIFKYVQD